MGYYYFSPLETEYVKLNQGILIGLLQEENQTDWKYFS